jgi:acyl-CoA synthetase (AMP-forming)/AMP-acid ligase II/thioesterase domain-containing protein/acyl carrier protein
MLGYCLLFSFKQGLALSYFRVMQTINSECLINAEEGKNPSMLQLSELDGPPLPYTALSLNGLFQQNVLKFPGTEALVCTHQPSDLYGIITSAGSGKFKASCLRWTYQDLDCAIERFANGLRSLGIRRGDPMVMFMANTAEYVIALWAAYRIGCVHVPFNSRSLSHTQEVKHMLQTAMKGCHARSIAFIAGKANICEQIEDLTSGMDCTRILVESQRDGWNSFGDLMKEPIKTTQAEWHPESSESSIFFTSGTTSLPKGCFFQTFSFPFATATSWRQSNQPMLPGDKFALVLPNNHAFGFQCLISTFLNAATIVFPGSGFIPEAVIKGIQQERCSHTAFVPTMVLALGGLPLASEQKLSSLRRVVLAGASPTEEVIKICLDHLGASGVENLYGMTEGILVSSGVLGDTSAIFNGRDISIGAPLPGAKIRVCAENSRIPLPVGATGEVHFSGPSLISEYIGRANDDKFYITDDGRRWFCTGDKAILGRDDRLYLVGRYKDTIIRGGENIEPSAIEAFLGRIPEFNVLEPQIVRAPDHIAGEVPIAIVSQDITESTALRLKETIRAEMGMLYVPPGVVPVQSLGLNSYPRSVTGKIQKSKLEDLMKLYWGKRSPQSTSSGSHGVFKSYSGSQIVHSLLSAITEEKGSCVKPDTRIIDLGVDSMTSIAILSRVQRETGVSLPSSLFFAPKTVGTICDYLRSTSSSAELLDLRRLTDDTCGDLCFSTLLQGTPKPGVASLFLTPPGSGYAFSYEPLPKFANDLAVYSLGSPFLMTKAETTWTVEEAAAIYVRTIRNLRPQGPYILGGWSMGAITAYEIAFQLHQQGERVLGVINLDMPLPRSDSNTPEPTVKLLEILGFYPPIRREGKPDMEIPAYRRQHSLSSVRAKMEYTPHPICLSDNPSPVRIFVIWAGHGDPDRLPSMLLEANKILKENGPQTQKRTDQEWLKTPRESFGPGGWAEMVGRENVECHVIDHADHDSMMDPEVVCFGLSYFFLGH